MGEWRDASRAAFTAHEFSAWSREFSEGDDAKLLHEVRTKILPRRGIEAREDEVLITEGWKQGLDLIVQLFVDSKRPVAIEEPGLPEIRELLALAARRRCRRSRLITKAWLSMAVGSLRAGHRHAAAACADGRVDAARAPEAALAQKSPMQDGLIVEIDASSGGVNDSQAPAMKSLDASGTGAAHLQSLRRVWAWLAARRRRGAGRDHPRTAQDPQPRRGPRAARGAAHRRVADFARSSRHAQRRKFAA